MLQPRAAPQQGVRPPALAARSDRLPCAAAATALQGSGGGWASASSSRGPRPARAGCPRAAGLGALAALALPATALAGRRGADGRVRRSRALRRAATVPVTIEEEKQKSAKDFALEGKKVEVLAPSQKWREATVVRRLQNGVQVHYEGFDSKYDEVLPFTSSRLRKYGQLRSETLSSLKASFISQYGASQCPGCGVELQSHSPMKLGYIPPHKFQPNAEEDGDGKNSDLVLTPEEEVNLLLKADGYRDGASATFPKRASQKKFRVIQNIYLNIRKEPDIDSEIVEGESLRFGEEFEVSEIRQRPDTRTYFKLADGRGWVFDWAVLQGTRQQLVVPLEDKGREQIKKIKSNYNPVCMRCWGLMTYNDVDNIYRPDFHGEERNDEMSPEAFEKMLTDTFAEKKKKDRCCVLCVVDVFDFGPSAELLRFVAKAIEGKGFKVRIVANKVDLLPDSASVARIRGWVSREAREAGLKTVTLADVYLCSTLKGTGVKSIGNMLDTKEAAEDLKTFYLVGAANSGKSSLLNRISMRKRRGLGKTPVHEATGSTVSALPGTTLSNMAVRYERNRVGIVDTPGLLMPGGLASKLPYGDLLQTVPQKGESIRLSIGIEEKQTIMIGGLGRIDLVEGERKQFTVFTGNKVRLHRGKTERIMDACENIVGKTLTPPAKLETYKKLLPWVPHRFELEGKGWDEACADIVFHGLGWVACQGWGPFTVEAWAPEGVRVSVRHEALLPYEARSTGVKYGGRNSWFTIGGRPTQGLGPKSKPMKPWKYQLGRYKGQKRKW